MISVAPDRWGVAMALYMIGFISYGATLVFYAAIFPRLARNTPHARQLREKYENGEIPAEVYETEESLEKNRISNISTVCRFSTNHLQMMPIARLLDAQQHWVYRYARLKPIPFVAKGERPKGR